MTEEHKSILLLGPPGVEKRHSCVSRARLADEHGKRVIVVDTR